MIPFSGFRGTTLVDYPGKVAAILFVSGCNLRCPYCHNGRLFQVDENSLISAHFLMDKLRERKSFIDGVVFTGGEPSLYDELADFISEVKSDIGLSVKLDSNGLNPEFLKKVAGDIDYFAIDIKTTPHLYATILGGEIDEKTVGENLMKTKLFLESQTDKTIEYRTTLYPPVISLDGLEEMAHLVPRNARWYLQKFVAETAWSETAKKTLGYSNKQIQDMAEQLKKVSEKSEIFFRV
ncbi:anaerobic ribonucleoside-triphosphate reductase activating protein [bacterium]|nr:anaerobic ribonucleoside-triphosphate reductase activating protein [bacterium]